MTPPRTAAVLLAAGSGTRSGAEQNKVLKPVADRPMLAWSLATLAEVEGISHVVIVTREGDSLEPLREWLGDFEPWVVTGGATRHQSEERALAVLRPLVEAGELDVIALHDAARPAASAALWRRTIAAAAEHRAALPGLRMSGLIRGEGQVTSQELASVATPQAFDAATLVAAYDAARDSGFAGTDTAASVEAYGAPVHVVPGEATNLKVTFAEDFEVAARLLRGR